MHRLFDIFFSICRFVFHFCCLNLDSAVYHWILALSGFSTFQKRLLSTIACSFQSWINNTNNFSSSQLSPFLFLCSLRSRRLEVVSTRKNGHARRRHARGEGAPARKAPENRFPPPLQLPGSRCVICQKFWQKTTDQKVLYILSSV